jgi:hypothetical protein
LDDLDGSLALLCPEQSQGCTLALRITKKHPSQRHRNTPGMTPQGGSRGQFDLAANASIPVSGCFLPERVRINQTVRNRG